MEQKKIKKNRKKHMVKLTDKYVYIRIIVTFILLFLLVLLVRHIYLIKYYSPFKEKMEWYEFNKLYNNEKADTMEKVEKSEIAKLSFGVVLNETNSNYASKWYKNTFDKDYTENRAWLELANSYNIRGIEKEDFDNVASKVDAAIYIVQALEKYQEIEIEVTETLKEKLIKNVDENYIEYINKAISIGILKNKKSDITDNTLTKGEFNKMLITVVEKFNTVYYKSLFNNNTDGVKVVIDEDMLPSNSEMYPYIIDSIDKEIYEITTKNMVSQISESPVEVYKLYKEEYSNTDKNVTTFFDLILNVDYQNIDKEKFIDDLKGYLVYSVNTEINGKKVYINEIEDYVEYVISNKIILEGKATPLLPIIYSNGMLHFLRTKIEFEIINSNTNNNLLLWDENVIYSGKKIEVYVDVPVSPTHYSKAFRVFNSYSLMDFIVVNDGNVEVK